MAPELMKGYSVVHFESDYWSLGILLFEMAVGIAPFITKGRGKQEMERVINSEHPSYPCSMSVDLKKLIEGLL